MNAQQYQMMRVVQKIPVFKGFDIKEVVRLLKVCHSTVFKAGQAVYAIGEPSSEMLILLKGALNVTGKSGEVLATLGPGSATGEMGLFTGHPRSANIVAVDQSACLIIRKPELIALLSNNKEMHLKLLYNMIYLLSQRLGDANRLNEELSDKLEKLQCGEAEEEEPQEEEEEEEYPGEEDDEDDEDLEYDEKE